MVHFMSLTFSMVLNRNPYGQVVLGETKLKVRSEEYLDMVKGYALVKLDNIPALSKGR